MPRVADEGCAHPRTETPGGAGEASAGRWSGVGEVAAGPVGAGRGGSARAVRDFGPLRPLGHLVTATLWHMSESPLRIVVAKPGLDGHDRGAKVIARALRDAGMEVIYTGLHQTPEQIVEASIQEDADAVGLSVLSGAHMTLFAKTIELLKERDAADITVFGGGIIPEDDIPQLTDMGVAKVFTPGATTTEIVDWVKAHVSAS